MRVTGCATDLCRPSPDSPDQLELIERMGQSEIVCVEDCEELVEFGLLVWGERGASWVGLGVRVGVRERVAVGLSSLGQREFDSHDGRSERSDG